MVIIYLKDMDLNVLVGMIEIFRNDDVGNPFIIKVIVFYTRHGVLSGLLNTPK